jgi:hypothetical protein
MLSAVKKDYIWPLRVYKLYTLSGQEEPLPVAEGFPAPTPNPPRDFGGSTPNNP